MWLMNVYDKLCDLFDSVRMNFGEGEKIFKRDIL